MNLFKHFRKIYLDHSDLFESHRCSGIAICTKKWDLSAPLCSVEVLHT